MDKLRIAIVGYGKMGRIRSATIDARDDCAVTAIYDPFVDLGAERARGLKTGADWKALLEDDDIDAVIISSTNDVIPKVAVAALNKGLHVFCEKPPGRNVADIEAIITAARTQPSVKLKFGFNHRYHEAVESARKLVDGGRMGDILWMRGVYGKAGGKDFDHNWRNDPKKSGGGILLDQGIHMLDLFHDFCGEFDDVKSFIGRQYWNVPVEDNAFAMLRNARGQVATIHSSATQWRHTFRLEIYLEKGFLSLNGILSSTMTYGRESLTVARTHFDDNGYPNPNPEETISYFEEDRSWEKEMEEFVTAIGEDREIVIGTPEHALAAMRAVERIYKSDSGTDVSTLADGVVKK